MLNDGNVGEPELSGMRQCLASYRQANSESRTKTISMKFEKRKRRFLFLLPIY